MFMKKSGKRWISMMLSFMLLFNVMPLPAFAEEPGLPQVEVTEDVRVAETAVPSTSEMEENALPQPDETVRPDAEEADPAQTETPETQAFLTELSPVVTLPPITVIEPEATELPEDGAEQDELVEDGEQDGLAADEATDAPWGELEPDVVEGEGDELDMLVANGIQSTPDPMLQENMEIQGITIRWLTSSDNGNGTPAGTDQLELCPDGDAVKTQQFQIDFSLTGGGVVAAGQIRIEIPASIWEHRGDGAAYGNMVLGIPMAPDTSGDFMWELVDDKIVITNTKDLEAANHFMIQGAIRNMEAHEVKDESVSHELYANITVNTPSGNQLTASADPITATIDTSVVVADATKSAQDPMTGQYSMWWGTVPPNMPTELLRALHGDDPANYVFIRWHVEGKAKGNQPFEMHMTDAVENKYDGIMLGASDLPDGSFQVSENGKDIDVTLFTGYNESPQTAYVWTAYPRAQFDEMSEEEKENLIFHNEQTITVTGVDGYDGSTDKTAPADVIAKVSTEYKVIKYWDDNDNEFGVRPGAVDIVIRDQNQVYEKVRRTEADAEQPRGEDDTKDTSNYWSYTWDDGGNPGHDFSVTEELLAGTYFGQFPEDLFDAMGGMLTWEYQQESIYREPGTNTWTITNTFKFIIRDPSSLYKQIRSGYNDPQVDSTKDAALNDLLHDQAALVPFHVWTTLSAAHVADENGDGVMPNTFVLEDGDYTFNGRFIDVEDVSIGAVLMNNIMQADLVLVDGEGKDAQFTISRTTVGFKLYGLIGGEKVLLATGTDFRNIKAVAEGVTVTGNRVDLPDGVSKIEIAVEKSDARIVDIDCDVYLKVHPTDTVKKMVQDALDREDFICFPLWNAAYSYAQYAGDETRTVKEKRYVPGTNRQEIEILDTEITYNPGDYIVPRRQAEDTGFLHGRDYKVAVDLAKSFTVVEEDAAQKRIKLHTTLTLTQQSNIIRPTEYQIALENGDIPNTRSGYYYDLLPVGVQPDLSTLSVSGGDAIADYWVKTDYQGSGRTLLIVKVTLQDQITNVTEPTELSKEYETYPTMGHRNRHTLDFDVYCAYETLPSAESIYMHNVAAYGADEPELGKLSGWEGENNDPNGGNNTLSGIATESSEEDGLMTGLPYGGNSFVYAGAELHADNPVSSAMAGVVKEVSLPGTGAWSRGENNDVNVQEGGRYLYRLTMTGSTEPNTNTKDIILLDVLEQATIDDDYRWWGSLVSVDVSQLVAMGVAPVIYYSTAPDLDISRGALSQYDELGGVSYYLQNSGLWSTSVANMADVTAIAIDARKNSTDGGEFLLDPGENLVVTLLMQAPYDDPGKGMPYYFAEGTDGGDFMQNAHAYNSVSLDSTIVSTTGDSHDLVAGNPTKVGIYTKYFDVYKVWVDDSDRDGLRPEYIDVYLLADGVRTGDVIRLDGTNGWYDRFDRVLTYDEETKERINYSFEEEFPNGFLDRYAMTVNRSQDAQGNVTITLTNTHEPEKIAIPFTKRWEGELNASTRPDSIEVRLYADGVYTGRSQIVRPGANGNWSGTFWNLYKYQDGQLVHYTVEEEYPSDYIPSYLYVDQEGNALDWYDAEKMVDANGDPVSVVIVNTYHPYGDLEISKTLLNATEAAETKAFTFDLELRTQATDQALIEKYEFEIFDAEGNVIATGRIGHGDAFTLKGGERIHIKELPTHVIYSITERKQSGYTLVGVTNDYETIRASTYEDPNVAAFVNKYASQGYVQLRANKVLTDRDGNLWPVSAYQFRFTLEDEEGNILMAYSADGGSVTFGRLMFTEADDGQPFTYILTEAYEAVEQNGYTYDTASYKVTITPHDNGDGTMSFDEVWEDLNPGELPSFTNMYKAEGEITLNAWKTLDVEALTDSRFTFDLYRLEEDGTLAKVGEATNTADGDVIFEDMDLLKFNETQVGQTYYYFLREQDGGDPTIEYDFSVFAYAVTVFDNGDGTLSFEEQTANVTCATCKGSGAVDTTTNPENPATETCGVCHGLGFEMPGAGWTLPDTQDVPIIHNGMKPGDLVVTKYTEDGDPTHEFWFRLVLDGDDVDDLQFELQAEEADPLDESYWDKWEDEYPKDTSGSAAQSSLLAGRVMGASGLSTVEITDYAVPLANIADDGKAWGYMGEDNSVKWTLYDDGNLIFEPTNGISGTMKTPSSSNGWVPDYKADIVSVVFKGTIYLPRDISNAFNGYSAMKYVNFSGAVWDPANGTGNPWYNALTNCTSLEIVNFGNHFIAPTNGNNPFGYSSYTNLKAIYLGPDFFTRNYSHTFTIPYVSGGTWTHAADGTTVNSMRQPTKTGWWYISSAQVDYSIHFKSDEPGGNQPAGSMVPNPDSCNAFKDYVIPQNEYILPQDEWEWCGWMIEGDTSGKLYQPGDVIPAGTYMPGDTITLVAKWKPLRDPEYTINFDKGPESAGGRMSPVTANPEEDFTIPASKFNWPGHKQTGWTVEYNGETLPFALGGTIPAGTFKDEDEITLKAVWEDDITNASPENNTLTFMLHGGEKMVFHDIPAGTSYQLYELTDAGWILVESKNATGVIEATKQSEAFFYNLYRTGAATAQLYGLKRLDGVGTAGFKFNLYEIVNGREVLIEENVLSQEGGNIVFKTISYGQDDVGTHTYIIREVVDENDSTIDYDKHESYVTVTVSDDGEGALSAVVTYADGNVATFENTTNPGKLAITKNVIGYTGTETRTFKLRIRFFVGGVPMADGETLDYTGGTVTTFGGGYVEIGIQGGETITFTELLAGTTYTIEEVELPSGWTKTDSSDLNGSITAGETAEEWLTNTYSTSRTSGGNGGGISLKAHKSFGGNPLTRNMFEFLLVEVDEQGNELPNGYRDTARNGAEDETDLIYDEETGGMVTNPWIGTAPVAFSAIPYDEPGTYYYKITEVPDPAKAGLISYDDKVVYVKVEVVDNFDGTLGTTATYCDAAWNPLGDEPTFENDLEPGNGFLIVEKALRNATTAAADVGRFTFQINIWASKEDRDAGANQLTGPFTVLLPDDTTTTITSTDNEVTIPGDAMFVVEGLPDGAYYEVTEVEQTGTGFTLAASENVTGTIDLDDDQDAVASFTNAYASRGEFVFEAKKVLQGPDGELPIPAGVFTFELRDADGNLLGEATADENGTVTFPLIDFTDEHDGQSITYRIVEKKGNDPDYFYDTHTEFVTLTIEDNGDGTMTVTPRYASSYEEGDVPTFINMTVESLYALEIAKTVTGGMGDMEEEFSFTLTLSNATVTLPDEIAYQKNGGAIETFRTGGGTWTFTLSHGESIRILDLPAGTEYTIVETATGYVTSATVDGTPYEGMTDRTVKGTLTDGDVTVGYTNSRAAVVPTAVDVQARWLIPMMALALAGALWLFLKRGRSA